MPTVKQYQPNQTRTQVASPTQASTSSTGLDQLAQGIGAVATEMDRINTEASLASAQQAVTAFERDKNNLFFNSDTGYFNTAGRDAYEQAESVTQQLEQLKRQYSESLDPVAVQEFERVAGAHITRANVDIMRHSSRNLKAWEQANIEAEVENTIENASLYWNDSEQLDTQFNLGLGAIMESLDMQGLSAEARTERVQNYKSSFAQGVIASAIASSADDGREAMGKWGGELEGPDRAKLEHQLVKKREAEETKARAAETVTRATNLVERYGDMPDARSRMLGEINEIEDVELRKDLLREATYQLNLKQAADEEFRQELFQRAEAQILSGVSAETLKTQDPESWALLSPRQQQSLMAGTAPKTDWVQWSELSLMSDRDLAKVNPSDYFHQLAEPQRKALIKMVKDARTGSSGSQSQVGRSRTAQTSATVTQIFGNKPTGGWKGDKADRVNAFYEVLTSEVEMRERINGKPLTSQQFTEVLNQFTLEYVQQDSFLGISYDTETDFTDLFDDIPADDVRTIAAYLNENNVPATIENIVKAREQALAQ